jgi:hypothetical protein
VHRARDAHADAQDPAPVAARLVEQTGDQPGGLDHALLGRVVVGHHDPLLGEDLVRQVGQRDRQVALAEVDSHRESR